jgi:hypothetical protein
MKKAKTLINKAVTGRPAGSTIYEKDEFIKKAKAAYTRLLLKRSKHPSREEIAGKLGISRATFAATCRNTYPRPTFAKTLSNTLCKNNPQLDCR